nr:MAG TPA: hypothetical protein [Caudoviricetes sp.]
MMFFSTANRRLKPATLSPGSAVTGICRVCPVSLFRSCPAGGASRPARSVTSTVICLR